MKTLVSLLLVRCEALITNYKKSMAATPSSSNSVSTGTIRLLKLHLPSSTGLYTEWMSFIDLFKASVDGNNQLSDSENMNYLKFCLVGDAAKLIASVTKTQAHLKAIWTQSPTRSESAVGLRKILETTDEHLRVLAKVSEPNSSWDSFLIF